MTFLKKLLGISLGLISLFAVETAYCEVNTVSVNKETNTLLIDVQYPQGFTKDNINKVIDDFIKSQQANIEKINRQDNLPNNVPGKNSLTIRYDIKFKAADIVSILMTISTNNRGAAHPLTTLKTFNFVNGENVNLSQLFRENINYLKVVADYSKEEITKKKISDAQWIEKGTSPVADNYQTWYFDADGLAVVFNTYQVAAYVYGPQTVIVPKTMLVNLVRPEIAKVVWGNS